MNWQKKMLALVAVITLGAVGATQAALIVAQYASGVTAAAGQSGSADPTSQGWTWNGPASPNNYARGFDTGNGGWNITDGTKFEYAWYGYSISAANATLMKNNGWTNTWTVAVNADAMSAAGGGADNYYAAPNNDRQIDNAMWVELDNGDTYLLNYKTDASNNVLISDGTTDYTVTGMGLSQQLVTGSPSMQYVTFTLISDGTSATLTDSLGNNFGTVAKNAYVGTQNRAIFGAYSGATQGSTVWNNIALTTIPEPATFGMLLAFGAAAVIRRRRIG